MSDTTNSNQVQSQQADEKRMQIRKEMLKRKKLILMQSRYNTKSPKQRRIRYDPNAEENDEDDAILKQYGSNKRIKIDSSKKRFNPSYK